MARSGDLLAFQSIPEDKNIVTESFLASCRDLVTIFGM